MHFMNGLVPFVKIVIVYFHIMLRYDVKSLYDKRLKAIVNSGSLLQKLIVVSQTKSFYNFLSYL